MDAELTVSVRGPLRIVTAQGDEISGLSRRAKAMLVVLSHQAGMRAERAFLAALLWSDRSEGQARSSLRQELSVLRRAVPEGVLQADRQTVWLDPGRVTVDANGQGEFLQGFDLASEGFEDWLRMARSAAEVAAEPVPAQQKVRNRPSLAVLAFEELGAAEGDMFADGVVEEITGALSRVHEFHVIARQSAFALKGEQIDIPGVAARLGVDYIVEGSVRRSADRVRIAVHLARGADGRTIWAERFDDRLDDLFDLQDRIAGQVAGQIAPSLRNAEIARAGSRQPQDRTAYELVLTALPHFWAHRKEENARAIELLDAAIRRDPGYGPALAYKAWALSQQPVYMWSVDPTADHDAARAAAEAAALVAGDHAPSLVATGAAQALSGDNEAALGFLTRALEIDPNNAWGWLRMGWSRIYDSRFDAAAEAFAKAEALSPLDPFSFNVILGRSVLHRLNGDFDRSLAMIREGMRRNPGITWAYRMLVGDLALAGREAELQDATVTFLRHYPHVTLSYLRACWPVGIRRHQPAYYDAFVKAGIPEE